MIPFTHQPAIELLIIDHDTIRTFVDPRTSPIARVDGDRFPASVVGIWGKAVDGEWEAAGVELELGSVEVGAGSGCVDEDRVRETGTGVVCLY